MLLLNGEKIRKVNILNGLSIYNIKNGTLLANGYIPNVNMPVISKYKNQRSATIPDVELETFRYPCISFLE